MREIYVQKKEGKTPHLSPKIDKYDDQNFSKRRITKVTIAVLYSKLHI